MYFRVRLAPDTVITGVVGVDQTLYWFEDDVDHLLGIVPVYNLQLSDVLPKNYPSFFEFLYATRLVSTEQLVECSKEFKLGRDVNARSAAYRFATWILGDEGDLTLR